MMRQQTKYLKLPFQFEPQKLAHDLSLLLEEKWVAHFNTSDYSGDWKVIALYAEDGDSTNILASHAPQTKLSETPQLLKCHYFKEVIRTFHCPIVSARLLRLGAGACIKPHRDYGLGYEDGNFRLHIPITTHPDVKFTLEDSELKMLPGECWYTNVNYLHSVKNLGKLNRVHLVIDGARNEWSDHLFFSLAPQESFETIPKEHDKETLKQMIEELKRQDGPASRQLIADLTLKLNEAP